MCPGPHEHLDRSIQVFGDPERRVTEEICPAAEEIDRNLDVRVILRDRAPAPHFVMSLVLQPLRGPECHRIQALLPHVAPAILADNRRIRRHRVVELHDRAPPEIVVGKHASVEVDVFQPAVIGTHDRRDCLECRRAPRGHLKGCVGTPRLAEHADVPIAPWLFGDPRDHVDPVRHFLFRIFVQHHPFAVA